MRYFNVLALVSAGYWSQSCVTSPEEVQPEYEASKVVERIGGQAETPEWTTGAKPFYVEGGEVVYVSTISMSGDARPEACNRAAADSGRVEILREIRDSLTASGQFTEISATSDPALDTLMAFLSQGSLSGVKVTGRYWERREESDSRGMRVLRIHCATKVAVQRSLLENQMRAAMNGSGSGNPEIKKKLLEAQQRFLDSVANETGDAH